MSETSTRARREGATLDREFRDRDKCQFMVRVGNFGQGTDCQIGSLLRARRSVLERTGGFNHRLNTLQFRQPAILNGFANHRPVICRAILHRMDQR
jgi:hypothetical protein